VGLSVSYYFLLTPYLLLFVGTLSATGCALIACIYVTKDYRTRWYFSFNTQHLSRDELDVAFSKNMVIVAQFVQDRRRSNVSARAADHALIMSTVLQEHMAEFDQLAPPTSYLAARRRLMTQAQSLKL
jgi:hypothetical protein